MESAATAGTINISHRTFQEVQEYFNCTSRGRIDTKTKEKLDMYVIDSIRRKFVVHGTDNKVSQNLLEQLLVDEA